MTVVYFTYFLAMPWYTRRNKPLLPERVTGRFISVTQLVGSIVLLALLVGLPPMLVSCSGEAASAGNLDLEQLKQTLMIRSHYSVVFELT